LCEGIAEIAKKEVITQIQTGSQICMVELDLILYKKQITVTDLACITGATVIDDKYEVSNNINMDMLLDDLGFSDEVLVTANSCTLTGDLSNEEVVYNINARIEDIKERLEYDDLKSNTELSNLQRKYHKKRLAGFTGGVATIMIGGNTQVEISEVKDRYDDAVLAIQAAIKEGVSYGGGYTYLNCVEHLKNKINTIENVNKDCYQLVLSSLETPFKELLKNGDIYNTYETLKSEILKGNVYDLRNNQIVNVLNTNIYDPTKVLIDALENAISVAKNLLSIKHVMYEGVLYE
jgi:chaperonin GroEL